MSKMFRPQRCRNVIHMCLLTLIFVTVPTRAQDDKKKIVAPQTIRQPGALDARLASHYHLFVSALEKVGFKVGQTDDPRALDLRVELDPNPIVPDVLASLRQQDKEIINVRASPGGGVGIGVTSGYEPMMQRAVSKFESQLAEIRDSIVIVADEQPKSEW